MTIKPLFDKVVVEGVKAEEKSSGGIILTAASREKPATCIVVAVGPGGVIDGKDVKMQVKVGDKVIFSKYAGNEVKLEDVEYIVVKQNDILAVVEN